jgi:hypothetical protein
MDPMPQPLAKWLEDQFHVESFGRHWADDIRYMLATQTDDNGALLRRQFADAILYRTLTPEQFGALTHDKSYKTPEELEARLRELWQKIWPGRNPADYATEREDEQEAGQEE